MWDSAVGRAELGGSIRDRFDGSLSYSDRRRAEIDRMNRAAAETQDRWRSRRLDQTTELDFPWNRNGATGASFRQRALSTISSTARRATAREGQ